MQKKKQEMKIFNVLVPTFFWVKLRCIFCITTPTLSIVEDLITLQNQVDSEKNEFEF